MSDSTLYNEDILLWSEQQAAAIRRLRQRRQDVPNDLDIENVAEEIESVGRSELAAVQSYIRLILVHLIKLIAEADSTAVPHWRGEIVAFHSAITGRYAPSMRQRININALWRSAYEQSMLAYEGTQRSQLMQLPEESVVILDDLLGQHVDVYGLIERLRRAGAAQET